MTSLCANPSCAKPVRYLNAGRLFQFEVKLQAADTNDPPDERDSTLRRRLARKVSHFWLCGKCAANLTLGFDALRGVVVRPRSTA